MPTHPLPPHPPDEPLRLTAVLDRACEALLTLHGRPCAEIGRVLDTVMHSVTNSRIALLPSRTADRAARWIEQHQLALAAAVTTTAGRDPHLALALATRLLLLCPSTMSSQWIGAVSGLPQRIGDTAGRALVLELAARCHIAAHRYTEADLLHDHVHRALDHTIRDLAASPLGIALPWRRVRLHWATGDIHRVLHFLNALGALLERHPDPTQNQLKTIAHAEALLALGRDTEALTLFDRALALGEHDATLLARADAHLSTGHTLRRHRGHTYAAQHWHAAYSMLTSALDEPDRLPQNHIPPAAARSRCDYIETLLVTPSDQNVTFHPEFTLLGPPPTNRTQHR